MTNNICFMIMVWLQASGQLFSRPIISPHNKKKNTTWRKNGPYAKELE